MKFYVKPKKPKSEDELMHFGRLGQKSGVHKFGRWQRQAKYANGQPDPNAKDTKVQDKPNERISSYKDRLTKQMDRLVNGDPSDITNEDIETMFRGILSGVKTSFESKESRDDKYAKDVASLGNEALSKIDKSGQKEKNASSKELNDWFLTSDQTDNERLIACLFENGYSKKDVKDFYELLRLSNTLFDYNGGYDKISKDTEYLTRLFLSTDVYGDKDINSFIDACDSIKNGKKQETEFSQESQKRRDEAVKSRGKTRANGNWPLDRQRAIRDARTKLYETKPSALRELDRAINKDEFQLDFLEAIQNSKIEYDGDAQAIAIEYAYYLLDPEDYMKNRELPYA
jgi:hypothetical protein